MSAYTDYAPVPVSVVITPAVKTEVVAQPAIQAANGAAANVAAPCVSGMLGAGNFATALLWLVIIAVIVWIILWLAKPSWVLKVDATTGAVTTDVDLVKSILYAIVIAIVIVLILWLLKASFRA